MTKRLVALIATATLAALPLIANAEIDPEVKKYIDQKISGNNADYLFVNDTRYTTLNNGFITVSASIAEIKPYSSGSEVTLEVVNWMGVALTDIRLSVAVVNSKTGRNYVAKDHAVLKELDAGHSGRVTIRFTKKPEEFDAVSIVFLGAGGITFSTQRQK